jgi:hypothetical protein
MGESAVWRGAALAGGSSTSRYSLPFCVSPQILATGGSRKRFNVGQVYLHGSNHKRSDQERSVEALPLGDSREPLAAN